jgi:hypothetical protein
MEDTRDIDFYDHEIQPNGQFAVMDWMIRCNHCGDLSFSGKAYWHHKTCIEAAHHEALVEDAQYEQRVRPQ